jgi:tetratricopeptide (TPR) repeat protein
MWNLLLSIAVGLLVAAGIRFGTEFGWVAAIVPGLVAGIAAYLVLARRTWKQLEVIFDGMQKEAQAQKFDKAIQTLESGFPLARWQFLVAAQLHSNIGILHYIRKDFDAALPHLEKSFSRNWIARGMLGAARYKKKDLAGAKKVLDEAVAANKKEGVLWATYAWILENESDHDGAIAVLGRAVQANASDDKLKACLQTLQNGKKLKLGKLYAEQWFQFHLEAPPPQLIGGGFRGGSRRALYRG